jgi:hypothetical protein
VKTTHCVTAEAAADPEKSVPTGGGKNDRCKVKDMKVNGNTITYSVDCAAEGISADAEMTYKGDTFEGLMKMKVEGQDHEILSKYTGKRLGDC